MDKYEFLDKVFEDIDDLDKLLNKFMVTNALSIEDNDIKYLNGKVTDIMNDIDSIDEEEFSMDKHMLHARLSVVLNEVAEELYLTNRLFEKDLNIDK